MNSSITSTRRGALTALGHGTLALSLTSVFASQATANAAPPPARERYRALVARSMRCLDAAASKPYR